MRPASGRAWAAAPATSARRRASMSYETDGSSDSSPHSTAADGADADADAAGLGSPTVSEASPPQCSTSQPPNPGQKARNEAEKHRRDRINRGVNTLSCMVAPAYLPKQQKKIDKITTLRLAANYMRRAFIHCFVMSLNGERRPALPQQIIDVLENFGEDSGFWLTVNRRGKILDVTENIQHMLGYNLVDVANEDLAKFVDSSQRDILMTEKLLGYPEDGTGVVPKNVTLFLLPKPTGRKDTLRSGCPVHVRGFIGPIESLLGSSEDSDDKLASESRHRLVPDDEVILLARVTPAASRLSTNAADLLLPPRPENEYLLNVRSDGVIVGSDSRISICAGYLPSEVQSLSAHSFLHLDDQMWAAVRQGLMFMFPQEFNSVTVRLLSNNNEFSYVYVRGHMEKTEPNLSDGLFTTRQIIISEDQARRLRREEMEQLQKFFRDVLMEKYPQQQVLALVVAIMGPMLGQLSAFPEAPIRWTEEFSPDFNLCMFRTLVDFARALPPLPEVRPSDRVAISELPSEPLVSSMAAPPAPVAPQLNGGAGVGVAAASGSCDVTLADLEPLRVDTFSSDLNSFIGSCSDPWQADNEAAAVSATSGGSGNSPCSSDFSGATYPSPTSTTMFMSAQRSAPVRNGPAVDPQQYNSQCLQQQSPSSTQCFASVSPGFAQRSPGYAGAGLSPGFAAGVSPVCADSSPRCSGISPGYAGASPPQRFPSPVRPGAAAVQQHQQHLQRTPPNGQTMMSPPCGSVVRQSCQFQPAAAPVSNQQFQSTSMMYGQQPTPAQIHVPDPPHNLPGSVMNRNFMVEPMDDSPAPLATATVPDLSLDLASDIPLLMTPPVSSSNPAGLSDAALADWANS